jgi:hypothetical protein
VVLYILTLRSQTTGGRTEDCEPNGSKRSQDIFCP